MTADPSDSNLESQSSSPGARPLGLSMSGDKTMSYCVNDIRKSLVAWLRWHAATRREIEAAPDVCKPLFEAMSKALGSRIIAILAKEIESFGEKKE